MKNPGPPKKRMDFEAARGGARMAVAAHTGLLGRHLTPSMDSGLFGFHGITAHYDFRVGRTRFGVEMEILGFANDLIVTKPRHYQGLRMSGMVAGFAFTQSVPLLKARRFDLDVSWLIGLEGGQGFKVVAGNPSYPKGVYYATTGLHNGARLCAYYWLFGDAPGVKGKQKKTGAIGLFGSVGLDLHLIELKGNALEESGRDPYVPSSSVFFNELALQFGVAFAMEP